MMEKKPGKITLVLTNKCNLDCIYCYEEKKYCGKMNFETATFNIRTAMEDDRYSKLDIYLFGGEPLLEYELLKEICEWTWGQEWKIPYKFTISTNGTLFDKEKKSWFAKNRDKLWVVLSLDGTKESHNMNRCNSFDTIDIDFFKENWPDAGVKMTVSDKTLPYLCENIRFIHSQDLKFSDCNLAMGIDWSNEQNTRILSEQMEQLCQFYIRNPQIKPANIIDLNIGGCENKKQISKICGAGETIFVNTDGKRYPCNYINPMSFDKEDLEMLMSLDFRNVEMLEDMKCFKECYLYPLCPNCYAANYSLRKKINERDKAICKLVKIQAYFSAKLMADKIKKIDIKNLSYDEKGKLHKTIMAVNNIFAQYADVI